MSVSSGVPLACFALLNPDPVVLRAYRFPADLEGDRGQCYGTHKRASTSLLVPFQELEIGVKAALSYSRHVLVYRPVWLDPPTFQCKH
jgi:hypothetical protein